MRHRAEDLFLLAPQDSGLPSRGPLGREDVRTLRAIPTYFRRMSMLFEGVFPLFQNKIYIQAGCQQP